MAVIPGNPEIQSLVRKQLNTRTLVRVSPQLVRPVFIGVSIVIDPPNNVQVSVMIFTGVIMGAVDEGNVQREDGVTVTGVDYLNQCIITAIILQCNLVSI